MKIKGLLLGLAGVCVVGAGVWAIGSGIKKNAEANEYGCSFEKIVSEGALATPATCTTKATYYYSCSTCGAMDTSRTFVDEAGAFGAHTGGEATCTEKATCTVCGEVYGEYGEHVFDQEVVEEANKAEDATCTTPATYYKSCVQLPLPKSPRELATPKFLKRSLSPRQFRQNMHQDFFRL